MARTLAVSFSIGDVFADRVASFSLVRELGRPTVLEIDVRYASDVGSIQSVGNVALLSERIRRTSSPAWSKRSRSSARRSWGPSPERAVGAVQPRSSAFAS